MNRITSTVAPRLSAVSSDAGSDRTVTVIDGVVRGSPLARSTASGEVLEIDVVSRMDGRAQACTVIIDTVEALLGEDLCDGVELLVVGSTRRRFFRSGGQTVTRTEVVARVVVAGSDRRLRNAAIDQAVATIETLRPVARSRRK